MKVYSNGDHYDIITVEDDIITVEDVKNKN